MVVARRSRPRSTARNMKFPEMLRGLRERGSLTQQSLSDRSGIPIGTIRNWEQGQRLPSLPQAVQLARSLDVSLDVFAECDEFKSEADPK